MKWLYIFTILYSGGYKCSKPFIWPAHQIVTETDPFSIYCNSAVQPQWIHNGEPVPPDKIRNGSIHVTHAALSDTGIFECRGTTKKGKSFFAQSMVEILSLDNRRITPTSIVVNKDQTVLFECDSDTEVIWKFNDGTLPSNLQLKPNNELLIPAVKRKNEGKYECFGSYSSIEFVARAILRVYNNNFIKPPKQRILIGNSTHIICVTSKELKWKFNGQDLFPPNVKIEASVIQIDVVTLENKGIYECYGVTQETGESFIAVSELIVVLKDERALDPPHTNIQEGGRMQFVCQSAAPVTWHFKNSRLPIEAKTSEKPKKGRYKISITSIRMYHEGEYSCEGEDDDKVGFIAKGTLNVIRRDIQFLLEEKAERALNPPRQDIIEGESMQFVCQSTAPVTWHFNNSNLPREAEISEKSGKYSVTIRSTKMYHNGEYSCEGKDDNKVGFIAKGTLYVVPEIDVNNRWFFKAHKSQQHKVTSSSLITIATLIIVQINSSS